MQYVVRVSPNHPKNWLGYARAFHRTSQGIDEKTLMLVKELEHAGQLGHEHAVALAGEFMEQGWVNSVAVVSVQEAWEEEQATTVLSEAMQHINKNI